VKSSARSLMVSSAPAEGSERGGGDCREDDDDLGISVDEFVHRDLEARARQREIALHTDALRLADSETWPLFLRGEALMNGRLTLLPMVVESSILAFSAASLRRCRAILSLRRSTPCSRLNSSAT